jgi:hypothetical protein
MRYQLKCIPGFSGRYSASRGGKIFSNKCRRFMKPYPTEQGYLMLNLFTDNGRKTTYVHRLIAATFIPNRKGLNEVNHLNAIKADNRASNLEWSDRIHNVEHAIRRGLQKAMSAKDVRSIRRLHQSRKRGFGYRALAKRFGVSRHVVRDIIIGKTRKHIR